MILCPGGAYMASFNPISANLLEKLPCRCSPRQAMTDPEDEDEFEDDYD
jgi:hypothetical protein